VKTLRSAKRQQQHELNSYSLACNSHNNKKQYAHRILYKYRIYKSCTPSCYIFCCHLFIVAIILFTVKQYSQILADTQYRKIATRKYTVSEPNMVYVTALPCKKLIHVYCYLYTVNVKIFTLDPTHVSKITQVIADDCLKPVTPRVTDHQAA